MKGRQLLPVGACALLFAGCGETPEAAVERTVSAYQERLASNKPTDACVYASEKFKSDCLAGIAALQGFSPELLKQETRNAKVTNVVVRDDTATARIDGEPVELSREGDDWKLEASPQDTAPEETTTNTPDAPAEEPPTTTTPEAPSAAEVKRCIKRLYRVNPENRATKSDRAATRQFCEQGEDF